MRGILLINVGTPASTNPNDVKEFIAAMLSDPLLTGKPEWWSKFLAKNIIAPSSGSRVSEKYKLIWHNEETPVSPLIYHMRKLAEKLEEQKGVPVEIAMRYGKPDVASAFRELERKCPLLHEVIVFPLYPHYAQSTTQTSKDMIGNIFYRHPHSFRLKFAEPYYNHPAYIHALTSYAKNYLDDIDKLIFSYHSLPLTQVEAGWKKGKEYDYVYQLKETNRLFCEKLDIDPHDTFLFYSSQRGKNWLNPFLDTDISDLPKLGWKKVAVIAPGFPVDNLETLYDIDIEARKLFMEAGGEKFTFVPALNGSDIWVEAIWKILERT
ncbi:ferrochelatase [Porphyromonadaceae bacterium NLAE-zl-C104]|jgi:ferrochelatase|uniref:ferrochelatase n=1 Tax=Proteiniphilum TaxID=294702 RepID=UPI00089C6C9C|nr:MULTISPECIES: ferrochelatase [Proteiniphilum]MDY9917243.1 ferrochelatase [Proteiniphilum sp.]SEA05872.1 ferrochelatase [Porphyromonadaceae bacterium KH3R12]SFS46763.1 ferrochelatase [Porphyromonadaceae bacterium NLAE-zl-C104]